MGPSKVLQQTQLSVNTIVCIWTGDGMCLAGPKLVFACRWCSDERCRAWMFWKWDLQKSLKTHIMTSQKGWLRIAEKHLQRKGETSPHNHGIIIVIIIVMGLSFFSFYNLLLHMLPTFYFLQLRSQKLICKKHPNKTNKTLLYLKEANLPVFKTNKHCLAHDITSNKY